MTPDKINKVIDIAKKIFNFNTLDIVVVTYNRKIYLERCLVSLTTSTTISKRIFVIDDLSNDGTEELLKEYKERKIIYDYYRPEKKLGSANAMNIGINMTESNLFAFFNDDMFIRYLWDIKCFDILNSYNNAAAVSFYNYTNYKLGKNSKIVDNGVLKVNVTGLGATMMLREVWDKTNGFVLPLNKVMGFFATRLCSEINSLKIKRNCIYGTIPHFAIHMDNVGYVLNEREKLNEYIEFRSKNKR